MYPLHPGHAASHEVLVVLLIVLVLATAIALGRAAVLAEGAPARSEG